MNISFTPFALRLLGSFPHPSPHLDSQLMTLLILKLIIIKRGLPVPIWDTAYIFCLLSCICMDGQCSHHSLTTPLVYWTYVLLPTEECCLAILPILESPVPLSLLIIHICKTSSLSSGGVSIIGVFYWLFSTVEPENNGNALSDLEC